MQTTQLHNTEHLDYFDVGDGNPLLGRLKLNREHTSLTL